MDLYSTLPPTPLVRASSLANSITGLKRPISAATAKEVSLYTGISDRPLGWKSRKTSKSPYLGLSKTRDMNVKKWDGVARSSSNWDGLRRDPELWYPDGDCLVHLYGRGQSQRGPAFKVPIDGLLATNSLPLLNRFLVEAAGESPYSESSYNSENYFTQTSTRTYELYIPAPTTVERGEAFLYHTATRNFFAWVFGKSLVGTNLGGALVGLLNSMNEFRSAGVDNVQAIIDYMDEEGYADMRNQPDNALAILFFAEHFQFQDLWIDAFTHCAGMNDKLIKSPGFECISRTSRALITRSRLEMDTRLDYCGRRLGTFLSDDLSDTHLGLSPASRAHLDKFRSFLQTYYIAKLGYYPPTSCEARSAAFPKNIYRQMCTEFQKLYDFLVDSNTSDTDPIAQGGLCVFQSLKAFDERHKYPSMPHRMPLLPEEDGALKIKLGLTSRLPTFGSKDKMKPDPRLVAFSSLTKATNSRDKSLLDCTLVRAYRGFEKACVFDPNKADRSEKLSQVEARKVRWILVYTVLQTLLSATKIPEQVRDTQNVPYNICVLTAGCPPWNEQRPVSAILCTQKVQAKEDFAAYLSSTAATDGRPSTSFVEPHLKPDVDYSALVHRPESSSTSRVSVSSRKGTVKKALSTLGNMPELRHPKPHRASFHEILVQGYGNGTHEVVITSEGQEASSRKSYESEASSAEALSSSWSHTDGLYLESPATSIASDSRRGSDASVDKSKESIREFLDKPLSSQRLAKVSSKIYSEKEYEETALQPSPLQPRNTPSEFMKITQEVEIQWGDK